MRCWLESGCYLASGPGGQLMTAEEHGRAQAARFAQPPPPPPLTPSEALEQRNAELARKNSADGQAQVKKAREAAAAKAADTKEADRKLQEREGAHPQAKQAGAAPAETGNGDAEADERREPWPWRDQWRNTHHPGLPRCAWPSGPFPQQPPGV